MGVGFIYLKPRKIVAWALKLLRARAVGDCRI